MPVIRKLPTYPIHSAIVGTTPKTPAKIATIIPMGKRRLMRDLVNR